MKLLIIPIFFLLASASALSRNTNNVTNPVDGFSIKQDTFNIDVKAKMTHALKYRDKYYVIFKEIALGNYGGYDKRWLYIFSKGEVEKIVDFPKELEVTSIDFFVYNDSIILKPYMDERIYCFDTQNYKWKEINKADDLIFEDEKYRVYSMDFGEWGGKTWFKDKNTGLEYELEVTTPLVNKIDTTYYLTNSFKILKIENPLLLNKCQNDVTYGNIEKNKKYAYWYGEPIGFQEIFRDSTFNYFNFSYRPSIVTSFVLHKQLLHLYETDTATYIAKIEENSIKPIQEIAKNLRFYNGSHSYRFCNENGKNELLKFESKDKQLTGLVDIVDNNVFIHCFANKAELYPKSLGTLQANNIFIQHLNLILSDLGNLKLKTVELEEKKWKTYDNTPNYNVGIGGDSWNSKKYTIDAFKSFIIQEDSLISYTTEYYGTKENDLVRIVMFEWSDTDLVKSMFDESAKQIFKRKLSFLENCITQKVGKPFQDKKKKNYTEKYWKDQQGLTIELENMKNSNRIRLVIFQN